MKQNIITTETLAIFSNMSIFSPKIQIIPRPNLSYWTSQIYYNLICKIYFHIFSLFPLELFFYDHPFIWFFNFEHWMMTTTNHKK